MTAEEWIAEFCAQLGTDAPTAMQTNALLKLASEAAHRSERRAAPIACFIAGAAGVPTEEAIRVAETIGEIDGDA